MKINDKIKDRFYCACGCGKQVNSDTAKYINGHGSKGRKLSQETIFKRKQTCLLKYGTESPLQNINIKEKFKQTCLKNFGVESPLQSKEIRNKGKQTCLTLYGTESSNQSSKIKEKKKHTWLKNYGVDNPLKSTKIKENNKRICLQNYGVENYHQIDKVKQKANQTCIQKYGTKTPLGSKEIRIKSKQTWLKKYGVENPFQSEKIKDIMKQTRINKYGVDHFSKTLKGKQFLRIKRIKEIENQVFNNEPMVPTVGYQERPFLDKLQQYLSYKIIRNDQSFRYIIGRFPDGHIPELKLFIEFDEKHHFVDNINQVYKQNDIDRILELASLGYIVFQVSEKNWKDNEDTILNQFKTVIDEIKQMNTLNI